MYLPDSVMTIRDLKTILLALCIAGLPPFTTRAEGQVVSAPVVEPPTTPPTVSSQSAPLVPSTVALQITTSLVVFFGEPIDGLAQVTASDGATVTGTVTFYDGTTSFCTLPLTNGATCPASVATSFSAGTHIFTAVYSGDATHAAATSNAVTVVVKQDTTSTTLGSSLNPVAAGGNVVYTSQVQGAHGTVVGTVEFFDGTASIGRASLDVNGQARLAALIVAGGTHGMTAVYVGNANSASSTSPVLNEVVANPLVASATTLSASANPAVAGDSVMFTAQVSGGAALPTGPVTFVEGGTVLGSAMLDATGAAVWSTSALSVGGHSIVARYAGDASTAASISAVLNEIVSAASASGGFTLGVSTVTVAAGDTAIVPVQTTAGSIFAKTLNVSCSGLPDEASCSIGADGLRISTMGPRDCGTTVPYNRAGLPIVGPVLAGLLFLFLPKSRWAVKSLFTAVCAVMVLGTMAGCGTGNCTDLGSRPGTYTVTVTGSAGGTSVSQKVKLVVVP